MGKNIGNLLFYLIVSCFVGYVIFVSPLIFEGWIAVFVDFVFLACIFGVIQQIETLFKLDTKYIADEISFPMFIWAIITFIYVIYIIIQIIAIFFEAMAVSLRLYF